MHEKRSTKTRLALVGLLDVAILIVCSVGMMASEPSDVSRYRIPISESSAIQVALSAPNATVSWDESDARQQPFDLPLLSLHRQRGTTPDGERTLQIQVAGLAARTNIQVEARSHHADVSTGQRHTATAKFKTPDHPCTSEALCTIEWVLDAKTLPSDFYTLRVKDSTSRTLWQNPHPNRPDFVALDTWDVSLGKYTVRIIYTTLFPFAKGQDDLDNRLPPAAVTDFIEHRFVPIIEDTWQTQVGEWEFGAPLHPEWDADDVVEIIIRAPPYALYGGTGTYTLSANRGGAPYPERRIWWLATNNCLQAYDSLENAYKAVFTHEFFHLMQWNQRLRTGRPIKRWTNLFIEAQGKFAPSVQYPDVKLGRDHVSREGSEYANAANRFLTHRLNISYQEMEMDLTNKYDLALYWRFLYEQYGDMDVVRAALEEMAGHAASDVVPAVAEVMDQALARVPGPFDSFAESLAAFARANYALRLENGRCKAPILADCDGFYFDPHYVYVDPPLEAKLEYDGHALTEGSFVPTSSGMEFSGMESADKEGAAASVSASQSYTGTVPSSYGLDFIEVRLDPALHGRPLALEFRATGGSVALFNIQIWKIAPGEVRPRAVTARPEAVPQNTDGSGAFVYVIPSVNTIAYDRLAVIITRLDSDEASDPIGSYTITLKSQG